jgi:hypothetical protein
VVRGGRRRASRLNDPAGPAPGIPLSAPRHSRARPVLRELLRARSTAPANTSCCAGTRPDSTSSPSGTPGSSDRSPPFDAGVITARYRPQHRQAVVEGDVGGDECSQLWLLDLDGPPVRDRSRVQAFSHDPGAVHHFAGMSPDGRRVAVLANRRDRAAFDVWLLDLDLDRLRHHPEPRMAPGTARRWRSPLPCCSDGAKVSPSWGWAGRDPGRSRWRSDPVPSALGGGRGVRRPGAPPGVGAGEVAVQRCTSSWSAYRCPAGRAGAARHSTMHRPPRSPGPVTTANGADALERCPGGVSPRGVGAVDGRALVVRGHAGGRARPPAGAL